MQRNGMTKSRLMGVVAQLLVDNERRWPDIYGIYRTCFESFKNDPAASLVISGILCKVNFLEKAQIYFDLASRNRRKILETDTNYKEVIENAVNILADTICKDNSNGNNNGKKLAVLSEAFNTKFSESPVSENGAERPKKKKEKKEEPKLTP